jgi:type IV pilus assembly protein PilQ
MKKLYLRIQIIIILILLILCVNVSFAQEKIPKEYIPLEGEITLDKGLPFPKAIEALSEISSRLKKKVIVDPTRQSQSINVDIKNLNWRNALELITKVNNLTIKEYENYIEIAYPEKFAPQQQKEIAKEVDINTRGISISALFFDADRQRLKEMGINWESINIFENGKSMVGTSLNSAGEKMPDDLFNLEVSRVSTNNEISALIKALETDNVGEIIANPLITVMDGEEGRVQIGQDFSIKQRDFAGNVTDQFFSSGIILSVKPKIYTEDSIDFIFMEITTERSSATPSAVSTVINKTIAQTSVLTYNQEEVALAGLYSTNEQIVRRGIPFLKDIPGWFLGLRYLFGYNRKEKIQRELVILLKAEIVPDIKERMASKIEGEDVLMKKREELRKQVESKVRKFRE